VHPKGPEGNAAGRGLGDSTHSHRYDNLRPGAVCGLCVRSWQSRLLVAHLVANSAGSPGDIARVIRRRTIIVRILGVQERAKYDTLRRFPRAAEPWVWPALHACCGARRSGPHGSTRRHGSGAGTEGCTHWHIRSFYGRLRVSRGAEQHWNSSVRILGRQASQGCLSVKLRFRFRPTKRAASVAEFAVFRRQQTHPRCSV
jgi:hypothetical protein